MAYRLQRRDPESLRVLRNAEVDDLPEEASEALTQLTQLKAASVFKSASKVDGDDGRFTFYRDPIGYEPLGELARRAAALWLATQIPLALVSSAFTEVAIWGVGAVLSAMAFSRPVLMAARRNHRRARGLSAGTHGVLLLPDAIVVHQPDGLHYLPRTHVQEILISRLAAEERGKERKPARSDVTVSYRDEDARPRGLSISSLPLPGHDPEVARALQAWLSGDSVDDLTRFGDAPPADLARRDWARAWRRFWRLRGSAQIAATGGTLLTGAWFFVAGRFPFVFFVVVLTWVAAAVLRWRYIRFRCPRCGLSPKQPLRSRDTRHCLTCGLPIFTSPRAHRLPAQKPVSRKVSTTAENV